MTAGERQLGEGQPRGNESRIVVDHGLPRVRGFGGFIESGERYAEDVVRGRGVGVVLEGGAGEGFGGSSVALHQENFRREDLCGGFTELLTMGSEFGAGLLERELAG